METNNEYIVPTNDFAAYRESGRDESGEFDPELADDQYLVNEEYPDKPDDWGVDDGTGWVDEDGEIGEAGETLHFVAFYNHWFRWRGDIHTMIQSFSDAYLFTGDVKYARAGTVLLDRIADVYPEMYIAAYPTPEYHNIHGGRGTGKIIGSLWEDQIIPDFLMAYDAYYPGQEDQQLIDFLNAKTEEYPELGRKDTTGYVRKNIEDGLFRNILPATKDTHLVVGSGARDVLALSARILDEPNGYTAQTLEFLFQPGDIEYTGDDGNPWSDWTTTGGDVIPYLVRLVDRDGYREEAGPNYNSLGQSTFTSLANILDGYDAYEGADLWNYPKLYTFSKQNIELVMLDGLTPDIGDDETNYTGYNLNPSSIRGAFDAYGDSLFAQTYFFLNGYSTAGMRGDVFSADPEALPASVESVIESEGVIDLDSTLLPAYGFSALRDGENYTNVPFGETYAFKDLLASSSVATKDFPEAIQFQANSPGEEWAFEFEVDEDGSYLLEMEALRASTYGIYELLIDGESIRTIDFYGGSRFTTSVEIDLSEGVHMITFANDGKNEDSDDYLMALYYLDVLDETDRETRDRAQERGNRKRAIWHYFGKNAHGPGTSHAHTDTLNLGIMAHELDLAPDLGYPEDLGTSKAQNWSAETISHNTVMVNRQFQEPQLVARTKHFDDDEQVKLFDANSTDAYEDVDEYRRTTAMIRVDESNSYGVDFFDVDGGDDHLFSFHGAMSTGVTTTGLDLVDQGSGTYAGPDVPFASQSYNESVGSGFNYLRDVSRDEEPSAPYSVDWDIEDYRDRRNDDADIHLRLTMLNNGLDEAALATGEPPDRPENPDELTYLLARRTGSDIQSTFTSVLEPYVEGRFVESIESVPVTSDDSDVSDARAVKVVLTNGRTDFVARGAGHDVTHDVGDTFSFTGAFAVYSERDGETVRTYLQDGTYLVANGETLIDESVGRFTGTVEGFTKEMSMDNELTLALNNSESERKRFDGSASNYLYIDNKDSKLPGINSTETYAQSGAYLINAVDNSNAREQVTVDVGDQTFIRRFIDPDQLADGGYHYNIEEGDEVYVPLRRTWKLLFAEVDASTTEATIGERLEFDAKDVTDTDRWIDSLEWDLGDGTTATGWWTDHRYDEAGEYTVSLIATANDGKTTTHEVTVTVGDLAEPIARAKPSATDVSTGERVGFNVQDTSGGDRWIDSLEWGLGDGATATGWWTDHRYDEPGEYTVTLTATDNTGHSTVHEVVITVS
ncbi:PKD domain-containing protein (plasmid) [Natrinema zhouii]|uniref:PKD domain-containing protein n=1 Tax=Natrinema zhouii TaxID=1710539 RepID=UPI001D000438|nr:PKD domain-containing protein [Natrinema zhouii]UHQ98554.1 PKD domain-containing protein [Natrinema zhouii]